MFRGTNLALAPVNISWIIFARVSACSPGVPAPEAPRGPRVRTGGVPAAAAGGGQGGEEKEGKRKKKRKQIAA